MSQQKLVYAIIEFLNKSLEDGTVKQDDKEGLEVASALRASLSSVVTELTAVPSSMHRRGFWRRPFGRGPVRKAFNQASYTGICL